MSSVTRQLLVVALLLAAVLGLFISAQSGQHRLEQASRQVELAAERNRALGDVWQLLRQAESSQRGYILLDDRNYLMPFQEAAGSLPQALVRLSQAFASAPDPMRTDVAEVQKLSNDKFEEMRAALELFRTRGRTAAIDLMRTDIGANTMVQIDDRVRSIQKAETNNILQASHSWQVSRWVSLTTTTGALLASLGLMLLLSRLVVRHVRFKELESAEQAERRAELEQLVERRTAELSELSTHLQSVAEQEKAALSRELHDELGGLLVAARMDVSWIEERIASEDAEVLEHFKRLHAALQSGVEVKRRVVENLRPSLLDNLGLFPALHWQVEDSCTRAGLQHREHYPQEDELFLSPEASITVFRIVQEAVTNIIKHARATTVMVSVYLQSPWLMVRVTDDGLGLPVERLRALRSHGLAAMRHRAVGLGGQWQVRRPPEGGTEIEVRLPLARIVVEAALMPDDLREVAAAQTQGPAAGKAPV